LTIIGSIYICMRMEIINKYFTDLTESQVQEFSALKRLYEKWNQKINVISRKDIDNFYER